MRLSHLVFAGLVSLTPRVARAHRWSVNAGVVSEPSFLPEVLPTGLLIVDYRLARAVAGADLHVLFNTDTLQVGIESLRVSERVELNVAARAQAFAGGLLATFARGEIVAGDGIAASYAQLLASVKWHPAAHHAVELQLAGRQWFFNTFEDPARYALPPDTLAFEPRLRYTFWDLAMSERDRGASILHPRFTGIAFGVEFGADLRAQAGSYGQRLGSTNLRATRVNERPLMVRQWLRAGVQAWSWLRVQLEERASFGVDEDDLSRGAVGGMNPYAVQVPGLPWTALLSERFASGLLSFHARVSPRYAHELGLAVGGGVFGDPNRTGDLDRYGALVGAAVFTDLRWSRWTVHLRAGVTPPSPWLERGPHVTAFLSLARAWP